MNERWYYKDGGKVHGPVTTDEVAALVRDGTLDPAAPVRRSVGGPWLPACEATDQREQEPASLAAARLLKAADRVSLSPAGAGGVASPSLIARLRQVASSTVGYASNAASAAGTLAGGIRRGAGRKTAAVAAVVVAVGLLALALNAVWLIGPSLGDSQQRLRAVWEEARMLRDRGADGPEWNAFAEPARAELAALTKELERSQGRSGLLAYFRREPSWIRRDLIQIAKYDLPAVLDAGPAGVNQYNALIEKRFTEATRQAARAEQFDGDGGRRTAGKRAKRSKTQPSNWWESGPLIAAILGVDAVLVAGAVFLWRRRRTPA